MELETTQGLPLTIKGTWDSARQWHGAAGMFEQCKLYCQVMLGFELIALHKAMGVKPGNPQFRKDCGIATAANWEALVKQEVGLSESSARCLMGMAKASATRLKKLPLLHGFDPSAMPLAQLSAPQKEALQTGVRKLTDDLTQKEFCEQLGLWKIPQGQNGGNPNAAGKRALTAAEQAVKLAEQANADTKAMQLLAVQIGVKFTALPDEDLEAHLHFLDTHTKAIRAWLNTPTPRREVKDVVLKF